MAEVMNQLYRELEQRIAEVCGIPSGLMVGQSPNESTAAIQAQLGEYLTQLEAQRGIKRCQIEGWYEVERVVGYR
jgi:hypothetical protein